LVWNFGNLFLARIFLDRGCVKRPIGGWYVPAYRSSVTDINPITTVFDNVLIVIDFSSLPGSIAKSTTVAAPPRGRENPCGKYSPPVPRQTRIGIRPSRRNA